MQNRTTIVTTFWEAAIALGIFGCIPVTIKFVSANAITIGIFRLTVAVVILAVFVTVTKRLRQLSLADLPVLAAMGVLMGLHWLAYFFSIKISSASIGAIGFSSYGVHLIVLGWIVYRHKVTILDVLALLCAIIGSLLVIPQFSFDNNTTIGMVLGLVSGLFAAGLPILHQKAKRLSSSLRATGQMFFALIVFLPLSPLSDWNLPTSDWGLLLLLATVGTVIGHNLWIRVVTTFSTTTSSVLFYNYVVIAIVLSYFVLHESITIAMIGGAALIIVGNIFGIRSQVRRQTILAE